MRCLDANVKPVLSKSRFVIIYYYSIFFFYTVFYKLADRSTLENCFSSRLKLAISVFRLEKDIPVSENKYADGYDDDVLLKMKWTF